MLIDGQPLEAPAAPLNDLLRVGPTFNPVGATAAGQVKKLVPRKTLKAVGGRDP